jgi:hypothetical protein
MMKWPVVIAFLSLASVADGILAGVAANVAADLTAGITSSAADGLGALGCSGADQDLRFHGNVFAAERPPTDREMEIARLWIEKVADFPWPADEPVVKSSPIDGDALRASIAEGMGLGSDEVESPKPHMRRHRPNASYLGYGDPDFDFRYDD